jgi:NAD(P)-dependent dehydrogenase (short-subunit alcohol dehydrogenase family)
MAEGQDLTGFFISGESELDAGVSAGEPFYFRDVADAGGEQIDKLFDAGRMIAGRFALDEFANEGDDVFLLRSGVAEIRIHRMASMTREAVIVTGGSRGIGAAVARLASANGFPVAVNYAKNKAAAEHVVREIVSAGGRAIAIQGDVAYEADIVRLFETAGKEFGAIGGLVNNAGITGGFARVEKVTADAIAQVLAVNVAGMMLCAREAVQRMSTRLGGKGGSIVNLSSLVARTGGSGEWVHYAATKGAVNSFTIGLAREVAEEGIRVNAVAPGLIETDLHADNGAPDRLDRLRPTIPMKRAGTAAEVAEGVAWLLSAAASYTTGSILEIGGGR